MLVRSSQLKKFLPVAFVCVLSGMMVFAVNDAYVDHADERAGSHDTSDERVPTGTKIGEQAPIIRQPNLHGDPINSEDYRGKIVLVNFWATWCMPCREELPELQRIHEEYEERVVVLGINLTKAEATEDTVHSFAATSKVTFPIVLDREGEAMNAYRIVASPTTYVLDENGIIRQRWLGAVDYDTVRQVIDNL